MAWTWWAKNSAAWMARLHSNPEADTDPNVGGGLPPMAVDQLMNRFIDTPLSGTSPLPHSSCGAATDIAPPIR